MLIKRETIFLTTALLALLLFSCNSNAIVNNPNESGEIGSIYIKVNGFFWMLRPWKEGTLVTIDGKARFAELSFVGKDRAKIKPLINYPRMALDQMLVAYPEYDLCITNSFREIHLADIAAGKTKSFAPLLSGIHDDPYPILIDGEEGLIVFPYILMNNVFRTERIKIFSLSITTKKTRLLENGKLTELCGCIFLSTPRIF